MAKSTKPTPPAAPLTGAWEGFVARVATPATPEQIAATLADGYEAAIGGECPPGVLAATTAQVCLETGARVDPNHDGVTTAEEQAAGYWNGNCGNVRGTYGGWWTSFRAGEGYGAKAVILEPGPMNRFRSYVGPDDDTKDPAVLTRARALGAQDFLALLARRYDKALTRAVVGDFHGYVLALHEFGYFTANAESYYHAEQAIARSLENLPTLAAYVRGAL